MKSFLERRPNEFRVSYMAPSELREKLQKKAVLYLPIGSVEWHNEHLPLGTDTFHAAVLAEALCETVGGAMLPGYWWNTGCCHRCDVTYYMAESIYQETLTTVLRGLADFPAKLLVLINGHGGDFQMESLKVVAQRLSEDESFPMRVVVADPYGLAQSSSCRIDHADTGETSVSMRLIPQLVRMERNIGPDLYSHELPFKNGLPRLEGGEELFGAYLKDAVALIESTYAEL